MDQEAIVLSDRIADQLRLRHPTLMDHPGTRADAFGLVYREAVSLVARARNTTEAATPFSSRDVLQRIMNLVVP